VGKICVVQSYVPAQNHFLCDLYITLTPKLTRVTRKLTTEMNFLKVIALVLAAVVGTAAALTDYPPVSVSLTYESQ